MDMSMVKGMVIGGVVVTAITAGGVAGYRNLAGPSYAEVTGVKEMTETVSTPREQCEDVVVQKRAAVKDENRVAGTAIGAVAGGLLGSTIGGGTGRTLATVGGAVAGGYAGNQVQKNMQNKDVVSTTERRCKTVQETSTRHLGYDVTYRLNGKEDTVRMSHKPGNQIPVKDGKLVLDPPPAKS